MAIYHFEAKIISRGAGRSAIAAAAYQSGERLYNDYDGITHDYRKKGGVLFSEILLPPQAPAEWFDRETLWNAVETEEKSKASRLARQLIVALPLELSQPEWAQMIHTFVQEKCVDLGMCADYAIHDPDGHNPHAHIMLTTRPLDAQGNWEWKTKKEYLCRRGQEEKGFISEEIPAARADGWEKQYKYKKGRKTGWFTPTEAALESGWTRTSKQPKTAKFGRQNPVSERWNSEAQLLQWREEWAEAVNMALYRKGLENTVSHLSYAEQGVEEQPTIHEGCHARNLEKEGKVADRCEINRQIKADNRLLRTLRQEVAKLTKAAIQTVESIAAKLESLWKGIVKLEYRIETVSSEIAHIRYRDGEHEKALNRYAEQTARIEETQADRKELQTQRENCGLLHFRKAKELDGKIAELTEQIEDMKQQRQMELSRAGVTDIRLIPRQRKELQSALGKLESDISKLEEQRNALAEQFQQEKAQISPENEEKVLDARVNLRIEEKDLYADLRAEFGTGNRFDFYAAVRKTNQMLNDPVSSMVSMEIDRRIELAEQQKMKEHTQHSYSRGWGMTR